MSPGSDMNNMPKHATTLNIYNIVKEWLDDYMKYR
jgi:hypothetical protein